MWHGTGEYDAAITLCNPVLPRALRVVDTRTRVPFHLHGNMQSKRAIEKEKYLVE